MLIDMHAHSSGISKCCRASITEVIEKAKSVGIDGVILTNHYAESYVGEDGPHALAQRYIAEYEAARVLGAQEDFAIFFGIEVTAARHNNVHLLVYGVDTDFLLQNPTLYDLTQKELYRLVHRAGGVLVQAHPIRRGKNVLLDLSLLDGVEINSHPKYDSAHSEELFAIAMESDMLLTSGGDYHADTHRVRCGVYLPETVKDTRGLIDYLQHSKKVRLCIHEPYETVAKDIWFPDAKV